MRRRVIDIKVSDKIFLERHFLCSKAHKKVAKLHPKFDGSYLMLKVVKKKLILVIEGKPTTVNTDQVRVYKTHFSSSSSFYRTP